MKKDYIFKTIEFSKVNEETDYIVTQLEPVIPDEDKLKFPSKTFIYNSYEDLEEELMELFGYTEDQVSNIVINQVNNYYNPLYTTKWYIGALYDFMHDPEYLDDPANAFKTEFSFEDVESQTNTTNGYVFPERVQELIREKPINRIRCYVHPAAEVSSEYSQLTEFTGFKWRTLVGNSSITVINNNMTLYIHYGYLNLSKTTGSRPVARFVDTLDEDSNTYIYSDYNDTFSMIPNADKLGDYSLFGVNMYNTEMYLTNNGSDFTKAKDYVFGVLDNNPALTSLKDKKTGVGYIQTISGNNNLKIYVRFRNNSSDSLKVQSHYVSKLAYMRYTETLVYAQGPDESGGLPSDATNYITIKKGVNIYYKQKSPTYRFKGYYMYVRYSNDKYTLHDNPDNMQYIAISYYNISDSKDDLAYNNPKNYSFFAYNVPCAPGNSTILTANNYYIRITFGTDNLPTSAYAITNGKLNYEYLYFTVSTSSSGGGNPVGSGTKINLTNDVSSINGAVYINNKYIYIAFSDNFPMHSAQFATELYYRINDDTKYLGIAYGENGNQYDTGTLQLSPKDYAWYPINDKIVVADGTQATVTQNRYFYFTFANDRLNSADRHQTPLSPNNGRYKYIGYAYDMPEPISTEIHVRKSPDKTEKEIGIYKATKFNGLGEDNIQKIASVQVPYTAMGKYGVFKFDSVIIKKGEYLIIGGNRDTTAIGVPQKMFTESIDYSFNNEDAGLLPREERTQITDAEIMFYDGVNFANIGDWQERRGQKLPVDIGCSFATTSSDVNLTTQTYQEIYEQSKSNDEQSLEDYKNSQEGKYESPNYDLYVNLTYKFGKVIEGNYDYLNLWHHYKISCQFKNEFQEVIGEVKKFDASFITFDGSMYDKPELIYIDDISYGPNTLEYQEYFLQYEDTFARTILSADTEVDDDSYDVAYIQHTNMLTQLFPIDANNPNHQEYDKLGYYNYKTLADKKDSGNLPVVCQISITAYETATPLLTKVIPVSLAAYSLIEVTDDYIKSTVSKIEYDYIYGLTQRISRIEQYADRIAMSVQNIGGGLYSKFQMTEDAIRMEVVDTSKNIGSMFQQTAESITALVYDMEANVNSKIEMLSNQILLEVSGNLSKSGILLQENSALIYAPDIILDGNKTTIQGSLHLRQKNETGLIVYDVEGVERVRIHGQSLEKDITNVTFNSGGGVSSGNYYFYPLRYPDSDDGITGETGSYEIQNMALQAGMFSGTAYVYGYKNFDNATQVNITSFDFSRLYIQDTATYQTYYLKDIVTAITKVSISIYREEQTTSYSSVSPVSYIVLKEVDSLDILYSANNELLYWQYKDQAVDDEFEIYNYINDDNYTIIYPTLYVVLKTSDTTKDTFNITISNGNEKIFKDGISYPSTPTNNMVGISYELSGEIGEVLLKATLSQVVDATDTLEAYIKIKTINAKVIEWRDNDGNPVTTIETLLGTPAIDVIPTLYYLDNSYTEAELFYTSSDHSVATINDDNEIVFAGNAGTCIISANILLPGDYVYISSFALNIIVNGNSVSGPAELGTPKWQEVNTKTFTVTNLTAANNFKNTVSNLYFNIPQSGKYMLAIRFDKGDLESHENKYDTPINQLCIFMGSASDPSLVPITLSENIKHYGYPNTSSWYALAWELYWAPGQGELILTNKTTITPKTESDITYQFTLWSNDWSVYTFNTLTIKQKNKDVEESFSAWNMSYSVNGQQRIYTLTTKKEFDTLTLRITSTNPGSTEPILMTKRIAIMDFYYKYIPKGLNTNNATYRINGNLSIDYTTKTHARTVIGSNGIYSYINSNALYYFSGDEMILRMNNNGFRINAPTADKFGKSMALEVFYNNIISGSQWVSLFNYSPMINILWNDWTHVPYACKTINHDESTVWFSAGFLYETAKHRGNINIVQARGGGNVSQRNAIILPMPTSWNYTNDKGHDRGLPVGFTIQIYNSQCYKELTPKDGPGTIYYGSGILPMYVVVAERNYGLFQHFLHDNEHHSKNDYTGKYGSIWAFAVNNLNANFIDAHQDFCAAIKISDTDDYYKQGLYASFVWTGYIWKTDVDVKNDFQLK